RGAARYERAPPVRDSRELRVLDVDRDVRPFLQPERVRAVRRADREQVLHREHIAAAGLAARDPAQLPQLLERVDAHVRSRDDTDPDSAMEDASDGQDAVPEVRPGP